MNKMIKLPLFLGVVGGLCGALLATTNLFTAPAIKKGEDARIAAAYQEHFEKCEKVVNVDEISETTLAGGVTAIVKAYDSADNYIGAIYTATVKGYGGNYTFTASFANNMVHKVIEVSGSESNVGLTFLNTLYAATDYTVAGVEAFKSGSSVTYAAVTNCLNVCYTDYVTNQGGN